MADQSPTFMIEGARLTFLNFAGKEKPYNKEGDRNFAVLLTDELAEKLLADGWNVKYLKGREEGDPDEPYIQVAVSFKHRPPLVVMITSTSRTHLNSDNVEILDNMDIENVDFIARGYQWEVNDKSGIKAYLQTMYVTIYEDALQRKYETPAQQEEE